MKRVVYLAAVTIVVTLVVTVPSRVTVGAATLYGAGSSYCAKAESGGKDLGPSMDTPGGLVYACGPIPLKYGDTGPRIPTFWDITDQGGFQCTELAIRYLDLDTDGSDYVNITTENYWGGAGKDFATAVGAHYHFPVTKHLEDEPSALPQIGDILSEMVGPGQSGVNSAAIEYGDVGIVENVTSSAITLMVENNNSSGINTIYISSKDPNSWAINPSSGFMYTQFAWFNPAALSITTPSTPTSPPNATVGQLYNFQFSAHSLTGTYSWSIVSGSLPPGLTMSSSGLISGVATSASRPGPITVKVVSGSLSAEASYTIWSLTPPLTITTPNTPNTADSPPNATVGDAYNFHLAVSGGVGGYFWTVASGAMPAGLSLDFKNGLISGTPTKVSKPVPFTVKVVSGSESVEKTFTIWALAAASPTTDNLINNGGFSVPKVTQAWMTFNARSTSIRDWVVGGNSVDIVTSAYYEPHSGDQSVDLSGTCSSCTDPRGSVSQEITTVAGKNYSLGWYMAGNMNCGQPVKMMKVTWDGRAVGHDPYSFDTSGHSNQSFGWVHEQVQVVATSAASRVTFADVTPDKSECGAALDSVSLTASSG
jgi:choice-of-anchor C domain-containing protein